MWRGAALLAAVSLAGCIDGSEPAAPSDPTPECQITQVVDGDTFVVACVGKPRILGRLKGVDSPEIASAGCAAERRKGQAARSYLQGLVDQTPVTAVRYGSVLPGGTRQLVEVELGGRDLGEMMVAAGHAGPMSDDSRPDWCAAR